MRPYLSKGTGVFSSNFDEVKAAIRENPECVHSTHMSYPRKTEPLAHALFSLYSRSIVKLLLDSGAKATMEDVNATACWIRKRMIIQHMPNIADEAYKQYYIYTSCGAPRKEAEWFTGYITHRIKFKLTIGPELLQRAEEAMYTPPIRLPWGIVPGRQGYVDAMISVASLCPSMTLEEVPLEEEAVHRCSVPDDPVPDHPASEVEETNDIPRAARSKYYNHPLWPSPRAKRVVQSLKTHPNFAYAWTTLGLGKVTHDSCLTFLAWLLRKSLEGFLRLDYQPETACFLHCLDYIDAVILDPILD
jgi:hypothetical protein